jgi:hypothetical protein
MLIDIKEISTFYINLPQHTEKRSKIEIMLNSLGIKNVKRLKGSIYPQNPVAGCSRAHYHALDKKRLPFLLLEDDAVVNANEWNDGIIEVPDDADAVYLGTSTWGRMNGHNGEYVQYDKIDDYPGVLRVYNMLATHAIIYLSRDYTNIIKRAAYHTGYKIENYNDVAFAELQRYFNVYAMNKPLFSQTSNYDATNKQITEINHTECMSINSLQFFPYPIK